MTTPPLDSPYTRFLRKLFVLPAAAARGFDIALQSLRATLLNPDVSFSGAEMLQSLLSLEQQAIDCGEFSAQRGRLCETISLLQSKRGESESVLHYGALALHIHKANPFADEETYFFLHYRLAEAAADTEDYMHAARLLQTCVSHKNISWITTEQRLVLREKMGRYRHKAGQYQSALEINTHLLRDVQLVHGVDSEVTLPLLNSLAQNTYELNHLAESRGWLLRRLQLAIDVADEEAELDTLFQLGVLQYEMGDTDGALVRFQQRLHRAQAYGDLAQIEDAQIALDELHERMGASRPGHAS